MGAHNTIPEHVVDEARKLRAKGDTWQQIADKLGYHFTAIRRRVLPGEREKHNKMQRARYSRNVEVMEKPKTKADPDVRRYGPVNHIVVSDCPSRRMAEVLMTQIPDDTRDLTARLCGDPLPGRSALDKAAT